MGCDCTSGVGAGRCTAEDQEAEVGYPFLTALGLAKGHRGEYTGETNLSSMDTLDAS
jgi:hypothetical protein